MATFVDSPALASLNPASHQTLVLGGHEIIKGASHYGRRGEHAVVGTIVDAAMDGEAVEDQESARGLGAKFRITRGSVRKNVVNGRGLSRPERGDGRGRQPSELGGDVARGHRGRVVPFLLQKS